MTTTTTTLPTNKEAFFRDYLVPAGQLAEILIATLPLESVVVSHMRLNRSRGANALFNTLHRASLYAITPANGDLSPLGEALVPLMAAMRDTLRSRSTASLAKALNNHAYRGLVSDQALAGFFDRLPRLANAIDEAVGYPDKNRKDWLAAQCNPLTALTCDGRRGRWRTLVRNTSWDACLALLEIGPLQLRNNNFSSRMGVELAPQLWREAFPPSRTACVELAKPPLGANAIAAESFETDTATVALASTEPAGAPAPGAAEAPSAAGRLPEGVTVASTSDGRLQVSCRFDPHQLLDAQQRAVLKQQRSVRLPPALGKALVMRDFDQVCGIAELAAAVQAAQAWQLEQRATQGPMLALYDAWQQAVQVKAVQDKLDTHFNAAERRILASLLATEASGAPAAPGPATRLPDTPSE